MAKTTVGKKELGFGERLGLDDGQVGSLVCMANAVATMGADKRELELYAARLNLEVHWPGIWPAFVTGSGMTVFIPSSYRV